MNLLPVLRRWIWAFGSVLLLPVLSMLLAWPGAVEQGPGSPKTGRDRFVKKGCLRCHSIWEQGGKRGPNLASVGMGRNLYDLCASVWSHWSKMNVMLERDKVQRIALEPTEIKDIIAYLYYLNYYAEPGDSVLGGAIVREKGCTRCHAVEPLQAEGMPGRGVYEMSQFQGAIALAVAVWNHGTEMFQRMARQRIQWPEFKGKEVAHLVAYIRSLNAPTRSAGMELRGDPTRGRALFASKSCSHCHTTGTSAKATAPDLAASRSATSMGSLVGSLWNHYPRMVEVMAWREVEYPRISNEEMEDLIAYIYWLKALGPEGNAASGRNLYRSKQCATCHSPLAGKPAVAPNLRGSEKTRSVYGLLAAIWNHGPQMESLLRERNLSWPTLKGEEMRDLVAFFRGSKAEPPR